MKKYKKTVKLKTKSGKTANFSVWYKEDDKNPNVINVTLIKKKITAKRSKKK
tara:strand:+ start:272 stop:427 length:156 start_codon:yes stop_codon:yes gene_type:complete